MKALGFCLILFCLTANAETYLGAGIGESNIDYSDPGADLIENTDIYFQLFAGTKLMTNFNVEVGYVDLGRFMAHYPGNNETDIADGSALFFTLLGWAPIGKDFAVVGRVGFARWSVSATVTAPSLGTGIGEGSGLDPFVGVGLRYNLTSNIQVQMNFAQFQSVGTGVNIQFPGLGSASLDGDNVDIFGLSFLYSVN